MLSPINDRPPYFSTEDYIDMQVTPAINMLIEEVNRLSDALAAKQEDE